ncbi:hypothetical protein COU18_02745 [Candidatus Kaiserbacteria bacterium CG10_big_fil_rev_8_21_14_0_10_51_14]|uniref:Uncharacterized protein n=1 Tax=Candidatus Kaiserbacteria bacterium CG10_big_fil_rev_8_21_14_0_10_51_14 TaxID=1974610 RepID=A0A2H0UAY9_9BACT|nr:MAG: hypothetical protein COU18_02745 [Candidatus Kaiserbacteria bacterium CG10_big_fil_rev_8_21_14_0_10_51_14]
MELQYRNAARIDLQSFVDRYEEAFRELYRDSGLWNETNIIEGYRKNALILYDAIADAVDTRLATVKVLGRKYLTHNWYEVDFYVGTRLVIVHYSEDRKQDTRWVESVSIDRKPIIF